MFAWFKKDFTDGLKFELDIGKSGDYQLVSKDYFIYGRK